MELVSVRAVIELPEEETDWLPLSDSDTDRLPVPEDCVVYELFPSEDVKLKVGNVVADE